MTYLRAYWYHQRADTPIAICIEMNTERFETRKVEIYADGSMTWADGTHATGSSMLSYEPIPEIASINATPEFFAEAISASEFESQWREALQQR